MDKVNWYMAYKELRNFNEPWRCALNFGVKHEWKRGKVAGLGDYLYFLDSGTVSMSQMDTEGDEKALWYIQEGCIFGEAAFFSNDESPSYFMCLKKSVIYAFSHQALRKVLNEKPELYYNLVTSMACKMRILAHQTASLVLDSALTRLCRFLSQFIAPNSNPPIAKIPMNKQAIANHLGINRVSLYKILKEYEIQGLWSSLEHNEITIYKPEIFYAIINK